MQSTVSGETCGISFAIPVPSFLGKLNSMCVACLLSMNANWLLLEFFKNILCGRAEDVVNLVDLVKFIVPGEERKESQHFEEDAPDPPIVHFMIVVAVSQQTFGRSVPPCGNVLCKGRLRVDAATRAEVGQLNTIIF